MKDIVEINVHLTCQYRNDKQALRNFISIL
jgi:hypothetical protein